MRTDAEIYVELASAVARAAFATDATVDELRTWWMEEAEQRLLYELDADQVAVLAEVCREIAMTLPESAPMPKPRRSYRRRSS